MSTTPDPNRGHGLGPDSEPPFRRGKRMTLLPIIALVLALLVGVVIYTATRNTGYIDGGAEQPDPMPAPTPTSS